MKSSKCFHKYNTRGSAIIMALVTMTLLVCLGLALIAVSMGNLNVSAADAANNDAYYAAEAGVNSALEQIKLEVSRCYNALFIAQGSDYTSKYNSFFSDININASNNFLKPAISGVTTDTTFTQGTIDSTQNTCQYFVSCTATANSMKYKVNGSLLVKRVDVKNGGSWTVPNNGNAVIAGGTLNLGSAGIDINTYANVDIANLVIQNSWQLNYKSGGQTIIDPNIGTVVNDSLKYPSYTVPAGVTEQGNVSFSGADQYGDIYCTGFYSTTGIHGNIYCRGNVTIAGGNVWGNIICDGTVTFSNATLTGTILAKNGITTNGGTIHGSLFSPAAITTSGGTTYNHSIIYSSTKLTVGGSGSNGILFSGGDIIMTGSPTFNLYIAKKNITTSSSWFAVTYSTQSIKDILADPLNSFFLTGSDPKLDQPVFLSQGVTPAGSIQ